MAGLLGGITRRGRAYLVETASCFRLGRTLGDRARLAGASLAFHLDKAGGTSPERSRPFSIRTPRGTYSVRLRPRTGDLFIFHEIFTFKAYDLPAELSVPGRIRTVLDLGANIGMASLYFHDLLAPQRLVAVEPSASNAALLAQNLGAFGEGVTVVQAAVGGESGEAVLEDPGAPTWGGRFHPGQGVGTPVRLATVPELLREQGLEHVDLLKMDIEGAEESVFEGDLGWLSRVDVLILEVHTPRGWALFREAMDRHGFRILAAPGELFALAVGSQVSWI